MPKRMMPYWHHFFFIDKAGQNADLRTNFVWDNKFVIPKRVYVDKAWQNACLRSHFVRKEADAALIELKIKLTV